MPSKRVDYASHIIFRINNLTEEIRRSGGQTVILNDIATIMYGLIKPVAEIRILVDGVDYEKLADIICYSLGMNMFKEDILRNLKTINRAVLNPVFIPITIIEKPRKPLDKVILRDHVEFTYEGITLHLPRIEYLVAKLADIGGYPYIVDAASLLLGYADIIDADKIIQYTDLSRLKNLLEEAIEVIEIFPELENTIRKIRDLMEKIKDSFRTISS